ncbi:MAG: FAD-dependent thymidylate synthase, partial [Atribacterota bacterium]
PSIEQNPRAKILFEELVERSRDTYQELINLGTPREDARYCFIQAVASDLMLTANARELLHIFRLRLCNRAQWEIREGAHLMLEAVRIVAPTIFESAGPPCATGVCPEGNKGCGHPWKK